MIGSSFLNSSNWSSDPTLSNDFVPTIDSLILGFENTLNPLSSNGTWEEQSSSYSGSPVHSSTSDDCEWANLESYLTDSFVSNLLDEENAIDSLDFDDLDWVSISSVNQGDTGSTTDSTTEITFNQVDTPRKKRKRTKSPEHISNSSKSWSRMSMKERFKTAHALSNIISQQMGLQEQIEVIKLINPSAVLSPSATEFAINLSDLSDLKLKRICEYLRKHTTCLTDVNSLYSSTKSKSSDLIANCHRAKRKQKKFSNPSYANELKLREKKVIRQDKKEKRSGLFVAEKVIKKLSNPQEENEDVNILE